MKKTILIVLVSLLWAMPVLAEIGGKSDDEILGHQNMSFCAMGGYDGDSYESLQVDANGILEVVLDATTDNVASYLYTYDGSAWNAVISHQTQTVLSITGAVEGTALSFADSPMSKFTMMVDRTAGTTDVVEIDLQCSLDGTDYVQIGTVTSLTADPNYTSVSGTPCAYVRYNVITVGSGNTLQIHLLAVK